MKSRWYQVTVDRTEVRTITFTLKAPNPQAAKEAALERAGNVDFHDGAVCGVEYRAQDPVPGRTI